METRFDVLIVGAGPAGLTLANILGDYGVRVALLERELNVIEEPRAVGIDDEALRTLQGFGMAEPVLDEAVRNAPIRYYDSKSRVLAHVAPSGRPYGWPRRNLFFQPYLERTLRRSLERFPNVTFLAGAEVVALDQSSTGVSIEWRAGAESSTFSAPYLVGADGGRSFVREALGVQWEGDTAPMKWLVVDVEQDPWDAPYSAVYTSPRRPAMTIPLPYGHRRFEFQVLKDEDPDELVRPERVAELLRRFYPTCPVPPILRRRIYWHHSRTAVTFQQDRVFLVGDAAHLQPPFFGQGMNSGIRDVTNLGWKLAFVALGRASSELLASYDRERRANARAMVQFATGIGRLYRPANAVTEMVRNAVFRAAQRIPGARDYILQMKYKPLPTYTQGFVLPAKKDASGSRVGRAFPQPLVERLTGERLRLDDVFGGRLALLSVTAGVAERLDPDLARRWQEVGGLIVEAHPPAVYRRTGQFDPTSRRSGGVDVVDIYDLEGGLRDLKLAKPADDVFAIRPDRYVAATSSLADVNNMVAGLLALLGDGLVRPESAAAPALAEM